MLSASETWAADYGWDVVGVTTQEGRTVVRLTGPLPVPEPGSLRDAIAAHGVDVTTVRAEFVPAQHVDFGDED